MAEAAEGPPTKRQRLTAELEQSETGRHVLETVSCSICTEVFEDPVSPRGSVHTYCRACIRQALAVQPRCPLSNAQITIPRRGGVDARLRFRWVGARQHAVMQRFVVLGEVIKEGFLFPGLLRNLPQLTSQGPVHKVTQLCQGAVADSA